MPQNASKCLTIRFNDDHEFSKTIIQMYAVPAFSCEFNFIQMPLQKHGLVGSYPPHTRTCIPGS